MGSGQRQHRGQLVKMKCVRAAGPHPPSESSEYLPHGGADVGPGFSEPMGQKKIKT